MRKRAGTFSREELERPEPDEPRELAAAQQNVASLRREIERQTAEIKTFTISRSWALTKPLRTIARLVRERTAR